MRARFKKDYRSTRAILVLECPWELDQHDSNRTSVLPFVEGVAKYAGDTEVYHANFYDQGSFEAALKCLARSRADNTLVYIAAHGHIREIAGIELNLIISKIGDYSRDCNITGLMLGSCFVGQNTATIEASITGTSLRWCAGYGSECEWLAGTMIDCSVMASMLELDCQDLANRKLIVKQLAFALSPFSKTYVIGNDYRENAVSLENSITFVVRPSGQGNRAKTETIEVMDAYKEFQKYD